MSSLFEDIHDAAHVFAPAQTCASLSAVPVVPATAADALALGRCAAVLALHLAALAQLHAYYAIFQEFDQ